MSRRLLILLVTLALLLFAAPLAQAQPPTPPVQSVDVQFYCGSGSLPVSWSHPTGIGSAILIVDFANLQIVHQETFTTPSASVTVALDPLLDRATVLSFLIIVVDGNAAYVSTFDLACSDAPAPVSFPCAADGRLTYALCQPLVVYPLASDVGTGWTVYLFRRGAEDGEFVFDIPAQTFAALPDEVPQNCTIASSPSGEVVAYLLSSGQYLISTGPDEEGKVFSYLFDNVNAAPVNIETSVTGMPPELLPSCV